MKTKKPTTRERQFKHVLASERAAGKSKEVATRIAAATVNKRRAALASGLLEVTPEGEAPFQTSVVEFCADNAEDEDACARVRRLRVGATAVLGGGAAPVFEVTKVRARGTKLVGQGGSRRQWYPGKAAAKKRASRKRRRS